MTYQFICENCGKFELNLKVSEIPLKKCPHCGSEKVERDFAAITSLWRCDGSFSKQNHKES